MGTVNSKIGKCCQQKGRASAGGCPDGRWKATLKVYEKRRLQAEQNRWHVAVARAQSCGGGLFLALTIMYGDVISIEAHNLRGGYRHDEATDHQGRDHQASSDAHGGAQGVFQDANDGGGPQNAFRGAQDAADGSTVRDTVHDVGFLEKHDAKAKVKEAGKRRFLPAGWSTKGLKVLPAGWSTKATKECEAMERQERKCKKELESMERVHKELEPRAKLVEDVVEFHKERERERKEKCKELEQQRKEKCKSGSSFLSFPSNP